MAITERYVSSSGTATYADSTNPLTPCSLSTALSSGVAGDRFNIKADGTYSRGATDTHTAAGSITQPLIYRGYHTTPGDGFNGYNADGSLDTSKMPVISYSGTARLNSSGTYVLWETLNVGAAVNAAAMTVGTDSSALRCNISNSNTGVSTGGLACSSTGSGALDCDLRLTGASGGNYGLAVAAGAAWAIANRVWLNSGSAANGIQANNNCTILFNLVRPGTGLGIHVNSGAARPLILWNTVYGGSGNRVQYASALTAAPRLIGNLLTDSSGGYGVEFNSIGGLNCFNRFRDNASGQWNNSTDWASGTSLGNVTTDTGGPETDYVNAPSDLGLISASPATGAGIPVKTSIGALQRDQTGGGGPAGLVGRLVNSNALLG